MSIYFRRIFLPTWNGPCLCFMAPQNICTAKLAAANWHILNEDAAHSYHPVRDVLPPSFLLKPWLLLANVTFIYRTVWQNECCNHTLSPLGMVKYIIKYFISQFVHHTKWADGSVPESVDVMVMHRSTTSRSYRQRQDEQTEQHKVLPFLPAGPSRRGGSL